MPIVHILEKKIEFTLSLSAHHPRESSTINCKFQKENNVDGNTKFDHIVTKVKWISNQLYKIQKRTELPIISVLWNW